MKKTLFLIALVMILKLVDQPPVIAQSFPETGASQTCSNCVPSQYYTLVSGNPSVSDRYFCGASPSHWVNQNANVTTVAAPPSSFALDAINSTNKSFLSLLNGPNIKSKVKFSVSGFIPGQKYKLNYAVMASRTSGTLFGTHGIMEVQPSNSQVILATKTTDLAQGQNIWLPQQIEFTPTTTETVFMLSGNSPVGQYSFVNFDIGYKPLECILPVNKQVTLTHGYQEVVYPCETYNLNSYVKLPLPVGAQVLWSYSSGVNGTKLTTKEVESAGTGSYFAFYYHGANSCYSLENGVASIAEVELVHVPRQVALKIGAYASVKCPETEYLLDTKLANPVENSSVRWFNNSKHLGDPILGAKVTTAGTYYAFYYNSILDCYSVETSTSSVSVFFETCCKADTAQVAVQSDAITNTCPSSTANLTTTVTTNVPPNTQLVWFNNPTHTGTAISNPSAVGAGTYYAFIYDPAVGCYNTDNSNAQVKVTISACLSKVQLSLKAALQGALSSASPKMANSLQAYAGTGLLPSASPYSMVGASSYPDINNPAGVVGEVVDWVEVEIRSAASPQTVLQTQSLLLKPNGIIVGRNGLSPTFNAESGPVRVVLKHRNHLAIVSNPIVNFNAGASISYDFTTALSQASSNPGYPEQMVQNNGIWCLRPGDLNANQDFFVDGVDGSFFNVQFKEDVFGSYDRADINMDGFVDGVDGSLFNTSFYQDIYSTLFNY